MNQHRLPSDVIGSVKSHTPIVAARLYVEFSRGCGGQNRGLPRISRRAARLCRRLPAELPQGRGRGRLEQDDRLVQEVRGVELIGPYDVPKPFSPAN
jgi:hypothetical protein